MGACERERLRAGKTVNYAAGRRLVFSADYCVIEGAEHSVSKLLRERCQLGNGINGRSEAAGETFAEAVLFEIELHKNRRDGPRVSGIDKEMARENSKTFRIWRFNDEHTARSKTRISKADQFPNARGWEVFDDLRAEQTVHRFFGQRAEVSEYIAVVDVEAFAAAVLNEFLAEFDAARGDLVFLEKEEEFAATATEVDHVAAIAEVVEIELVVTADILFGAAEFVGEQPPVEFREVGHAGAG